MKKFYIIITGRNRVILYGGCNVHFSTYELNGNKISFSAVRGTRRACEVDNDVIITTPLFKDSNLAAVSDNAL